MLSGQIRYLQHYADYLSSKNISQTMSVCLYCDEQNEGKAREKITGTDMSNDSNEQTNASF